MAKFALLVLLTLGSFAAVWGTDKSKTVLVGGYRRGFFIPTVDLISNGVVTSLPDLPVELGDCTAVFHNGKVYCCGGGNENGFTSRQCLSLDMKTESKSWKYDMSITMQAKNAAMLAVGDDLWILRSEKVSLIPFNGGPKTEYNLPGDFRVEELGCAVGDNTRRFVIPNRTTDIWTNTDSSNPGTWTKLDFSLIYSFHYAACLLKGNDIYVTGGKEYDSTSDMAHRVSLDDKKTYELSDMLSVRESHAMGIINGQVAVFGGEYAGGRIEVYNPTDDKWTVLPVKPSGGEAVRIGYITFE